jgi:sulfite reductase beta subunit-like hemoprotein
MIGFKKVKERVEEKRGALEPIDVAPYLKAGPKEPKLPPRGVYPPEPETLPQEFLEWKASNVLPQKPEGYCFVTVKLPLGNIGADQLTALAQVVGKYAAGARFIPGQNFALPYVPEDALYWLWQELSQIGLGEVGPVGITDVQACPGDVCTKHLTTSLGLGGAARDILMQLDKETLGDPLIEEVRIAISGCPRACGQHHVAHIGFAGTVMNVGENQVPAYAMFLGGCEQPGKQHRLARPVEIGIPAKRVPEAIRTSLQSYIAHRRSGEDFNQFVDRVGVGPFRRLLEPLAEVPPLSPESRDLYIDWGETELFKTEF